MTATSKTGRNWQECLVLYAKQSNAMKTTYKKKDIIIYSVREACKKTYCHVRRSNYTFELRLSNLHSYYNNEKNFAKQVDRGDLLDRKANVKITRCRAYKRAK
jgi:carboxypeptidase C (cathepsin A)